MSKLHLYDCLRANKSLMAWGVEGRVPFLDKEFIDIAMGLNPCDKMNIRLPDGKQRMEKWILRKAFEDMLLQKSAGDKRSSSLTVSAITGLILLRR